jgi:hypothetical protein
MDPANGTVRTILRLEGFAAFAFSVGAYAQWSQHGWGLFALLFLVPDLSLLGYLSGPRAGAASYNIAHSYVGPAVLGGAAVLWLGTLSLAVALIWSAHIGFDRLLGLGLKLPTGFHSTHLGVIGRPRTHAA